MRASCSSSTRCARSLKARRTSSGTRFSNAVEGIAKVIGIVALIAVGFRLGGAVIGFLLGPLCALVYLALRLKRRYAASPTHRVRYDWRRILNAGAGAAAATIAIALMGSADVVLVKHYFPEHAAGLYAAASLGGKMLLYLVGFVPTVLLPQAADRHARGARTRDVLAGSLAMLVAVALCGLFVFYYFGLDVLHALVGHAFDAAAPLLVKYGLAMVLLALTNSLTYYGIATHRLAFTVPLFLCTLGTLVAIVAFHPTLATVVEIMVSATSQPPSPLRYRCSFSETPAAGGRPCDARSLARRLGTAWNGDRTTVDRLRDRRAARTTSWRSNGASASQSLWPRPNPTCWSTLRPFTT